jgi:myo-inositol-1(or 4)-monophosphatase
VRQALKDTSDAQEPEEGAEERGAPAAPAEKPTLKAKRIKAGDHPANKAPDAPF